MQVRELLHKRIRDAYLHPQFQTDVMKPLSIEVLMDQQVCCLAVPALHVYASKTKTTRVRWQDKDEKDCITQSACLLDVGSVIRANCWGICYYFPLSIEGPHGPAGVPPGSACNAWHHRLCRYEEGLHNPASLPVGCWIRHQRWRIKMWGGGTEATKFACAGAKPVGRGAAAGGHNSGPGALSQKLFHKFHFLLKLVVFTTARRQRCSSHALSSAQHRPVQVQNLSGGELQRVAITLALGVPADIYLIDEPSAYLDSEQRIVAAKVHDTLTVTTVLEANDVGGMLLLHVGLPRC